MTLHVLHSGAGYSYLLRHTAAGDSQSPICELSRYYLESGLPPGVRIGPGSPA